MGTNYDLHTDACPHCGRSDHPRHVGKSSAGWCFALHVYPEDGIHDLHDWIPLFRAGTIRAESGATIATVEMLDIITERTGGPRPSVHFDYGRNYAQPGPQGLIRHQISTENGCIAHGAGTWDCITGHFS